MSERLTLMIVDDSAIIRNTIAKYLDEYQIDIVGTAADGKEALKTFKKHRPKYVTLDITMPKLNGIKVLEEILRIEPSTQVLIVTALSDKETGIKAFEIGAKGLVVKPFTEEKLNNAFRKLIAVKD